jgi:hypothetical protein
MTRLVVAAFILSSWPVQKAVRTGLCARHASNCAPAQRRIDVFFTLTCGEDHETPNRHFRANGHDRLSSIPEGQSQLQESNVRRLVQHISPQLHGQCTPQRRSACQTGGQRQPLQRRQLKSQTISFVWRDHFLRLIAGKSKYRQL